MFRNLFDRFVEHRQRSVNWQVAQMLARTEYKKDDVYTIFEALNSNKLRELDRV